MQVLTSALPCALNFPHFNSFPANAGQPPMLCIESKTVNWTFVAINRYQRLEL